MRAIFLLLLMAGAACAVETKGAISVVMWRQNGVPAALQWLAPNPPQNLLWVGAGYAGTDATHVVFTLTCVGSKTYPPQEGKLWQGRAAVVFEDPGDTCQVTTDVVKHLESQTFTEAR